VKLVLLVVMDDTPEEVGKGSNDNGSGLKLRLVAEDKGGGSS